MGRDKRFLRLEGRTLLERAAQNAASVLPDAARGVVISGNASVSGYVSVPDLKEGLGPLGGIFSVLSYLEDHSDPGTHLLVIPVDMPGLRPESLGELMQYAEPPCVSFDGFELPVLLKRGPELMHQLTALLEDGQRYPRNASVHGLMDRLNGKVITGSGGRQDWMNLNTPEHWKEYSGK